jgi:predicted ATP-grasp superfamily ATP-dependent carboligase
MNRFASEEFGYGEIRILIVDDNSPFVLPLLRSFSGLANIHVDVLLSSDRTPNHFRYSRFLDRMEIVDKLTDENVESVIDRVVVKFNSDLLIPTREWLSVLFFRHKSELEKFVRLHPLPDASILEITGNKWNLNEWLKENGFPFVLTCKTGKGWDRDYPVLLKPVFGIGGKGIQLINDPNELKQITANLNSFQKKYFLQELIAGHDIDVSFFAVDGEIIYHTIQRGLISGKMVYSKGIEFVKNKDLLKQVSEIVALLNYTGIAHLDFRYSSEKKAYFLIDFNARYWSSVQGSRAMGVNFPLLVAAWTFTNNVETLDSKTGHYYFSTTAMKTMVRNLISKSKYPVKLKDTQFLYIYKDPLPELMFLIDRIVKAFKN